MTHQQLQWYQQMPPQMALALYCYNNTRRSENQWHTLHVLSQRQKNIMPKLRKSVYSSPGHMTSFHPTALERLLKLKQIIATGAIAKQQRFGYCPTTYLLLQITFHEVQFYNMSCTW